MRTLEANEWVFLSSLIYRIEETADEETMRRDLLARLTDLVDYDSADFFLCREGKRTRTVVRDAEKKKASASPEPVTGLWRPVFYNCAVNLSEEYDAIDYSRGLVYSGKSVVYRETDVVKDAERVKTEYFRRVYAPNHWHFSLQMVFAYDGHPLGAATLYRLEGQPDFSYDDVFLLDSLKDHISLRLWRDRMAEAEAERRRREAEKKPTVSVAAERFDLTKRETEVLRLMMDGKENNEIARDLAISVNTLKKHVLAVYRKIGVRDRVGLFKAVREKG